MKNGNNMLQQRKKFCRIDQRTIKLINSIKFIFRGSQHSGDMGWSCTVLLRLDIQSAATLGDLALRHLHVRPHRHRTLRLQHDHAGVNFINILRTSFLYKRRFGSFFQLHFGFVKNFVQKIHAFNVDEIDPRFQKKGHFSIAYTRNRR